MHSKLIYIDFILENIVYRSYFSFKCYDIQLKSRLLREMPGVRHSLDPD